MRLSWYADTGVAVFSIWQGGVCTGTFRLPIDDLPRMVDTLQRGPQGRRARPAPADWDPYGATTANAPPGYPERQDGPSGYPERQEGPSGYPERQEGPSGYPERQEAPPGYPERQDFPVGGYPQPDDYAAGYPYEPQSRDQFIEPEGGADYGQERFVPPYVRTPDDGFLFDNATGETEMRSDYGQHAFRHGQPAVPSDAERYPEQQWSSAGYSDDPRYR